MEIKTIDDIIAVLRSRGVPEILLTHKTFLECLRGVVKTALHGNISKNSIILNGNCIHLNGKNSIILDGNRIHLNGNMFLFGEADKRKLTYFPEMGSEQTFENVYTLDEKIAHLRTRGVPEILLNNTEFRSQLDSADINSISVRHESGSIDLNYEPYPGKVDDQWIVEEGRACRVEYFGGETDYDDAKICSRRTTYDEHSIVENITLIINPGKVKNALLRTRTYKRDPEFPGVMIVDEHDYGNPESRRQTHTRYIGLTSLECYQEGLRMGAYSESGVTRDKNDGEYAWQFQKALLDLSSLPKDSQEIWIEKYGKVWIDGITACESYRRGEAFGHK